MSARELILWKSILDSYAVFCKNLVCGLNGEFVIMVSKLTTNGVSNLEIKTCIILNVVQKSVIETQW